MEQPWSLKTLECFDVAVIGAEQGGGPLATMFQLAMLGGLPYTVLRDGVFAHPTFAESLNNFFTAMERVAA